MNRKPRLISIFFIIISFLCSCANRYLDVGNNKSIQVVDGSLIFYSDSNVLLYKSNVELKMDDEVVLPKPFKTKLPKKIMFYEIVGSSDFVFYYPDNQVLLIRISLNNTSLILDTSYIPSELEVDEFIHNSSVGGNHKRYNIKEISFKKDRVNKIIIKKDISILMYNIKKSNIDLFEDYLTSLEF